MIRLCDDYSGDVDSSINFYAQHDEDNASEDEDINKQIYLQSLSW